MFARDLARASVVELWSEQSGTDFLVTQLVDFVIVEMCPNAEVVGRSIPTEYIMRNYILAVKICSAQLSIVLQICSLFARYRRSMRLEPSLAVMRCDVLTPKPRKGPRETRATAPKFRVLEVPANKSLKLICLIGSP